MKHAICYVSNANKDLNPEQIRKLLDFCQEKNEQLKIKGVLLYSEGNFFQILEGEKDVVLPIYHTLEKDSRHYGLIQIMGQDIEEGAFDGYKVDILDENSIQEFQIPEKYTDALQGMSPEVKKPMERMLKNFIATR